MKSYDIKSILLAFAKTLIIFIVFVYVWLTKISPEFYKTHIGHLLAETPDLGAAVAFYLIFIATVRSDSRPEFGRPINPAADMVPFPLFAVSLVT